MSYFRNSEWQEDNHLKEQLAVHVRQGIKRSEILDFIQRDFPQYAWSFRTLCRRLQHFGIKYTDTTITTDQVKEAVAKELQGPGKQLGYRAMQQKIRQQHQLNVPRDLVYAAMTDLDQEGLQARAVTKKKRREKGNYTTRVTDWVHSLDGHCKLMGYQRSTFPLAVYGCLDSASRRLLWLRMWTDNCDPKHVARWYFDYLYETRVMASNIRIDKGSETGDLATMHAFLRSQHGDVDDPTDTVIYGKSTSNQVSDILPKHKLCLACEQGEGKERGREKRLHVGMAKDFHFQMLVIYVMFKLTILVASTVYNNNS